MFVWKDGCKDGCLLRLNPEDSREVQSVRVDGLDLARRDEAAERDKTSGYSQEDVKLFFTAYGDCVW